MQKQILINQKLICYAVYGKGKPVVLLHGFAEDNSIWRNQIDALSANFLLIVPDLPGSGRSEIIDDMSMEGMADIIREILLTELHDRSLLKGAVIIGHSMGGYITLSFIEKYPELAVAFGLFHSTAYEDSEEKKMARQRGIEFIRNHGSYEFLKQSIPNLFCEQFRISNTWVVAKLIEQYKTFNAKSLVIYYEKMMQRIDKTEFLRKAEKPVLFVIGQQDNAIPFKHSLEQCHLPQLSYIHILKNSAHMGMIEEVEKTNSLLTSFLEDVYVY
jgi:pimeloyl-ACP methyl ester carboxylesterase